MLCEKCKQREATTHYVETINGNKKEMRLCSECAREEGLDNIGIGMGLFRASSRREKMSFLQYDFKRVFEDRQGRLPGLLFGV